MVRWPKITMSFNCMKKNQISMSFCVSWLMNKKWTIMMLMMLSMMTVMTGGHAHYSTLWTDGDRYSCRLRHLISSLKPPTINQLSQHEMRTNLELGSPDMLCIWHVIPGHSYFIEQSLDIRYKIHSQYFNNLIIMKY